MAVPCLHGLAAPTLRDVWRVRTLASMGFAAVPALLMNLYITGLNQITDVEIDAINKPHLPIVAGHLSPRAASIVVTVALVASLWLGAADPLGLSSAGLNAALVGSGVLGTLYSLPPFRLKRFPLLAAFCIVAVRGAVINAGFFAHAAKTAFPLSAAAAAPWTDPRSVASSAFFAVFGVVIALMKDVPDVEGDNEANVRTFSVRVGRTRVFGGARRLAAAMFAGAAALFAVGAAAPSATTTTTERLSRAAVAVTAALFATGARRRGATVDPKDKEEVYEYYMYLWKLFYGSYLALPFVR